MESENNCAGGNMKGYPFLLHTELLWDPLKIAMLPSNQFVCLATNWGVLSLCLLACVSTGKKSSSQYPGIDIGLQYTSFSFHDFIGCSFLSHTLDCCLPSIKLKRKCLYSQLITIQCCLNWKVQFGLSHIKGINTNQNLILFPCSFCDLLVLNSSSLC